MRDVKKILIVTADACLAQLYVAHGPHNLTKLTRIENPAARLHERDFTSKAHDINTCPYEDVKKPHEEQMFAKHLAALIENYLQEQHTNEVCIFAAPKFLGMLKNQRFKSNTNLTGIAKNFMHNGEDPTIIQKAIIDAGLSFLPSYT